MKSSNYVPIVNDIDSGNSSPLLIVGGHVFTPECKFEKMNIKTNAEYIESLLPDFGNMTAESAKEQIYDASDCYVIPGLIDLHFHGCIGADISDGTCNSLSQLADYELRHGITAICPATMTVSEDNLVDILHSVNHYKSNACSTKNRDVATEKTSDFTSAGADVLGLHLEGPFISEQKKGAQNADFIAKPNIELIHRLQNISPDVIKMITVAPEVIGADTLIELLHQTYPDIVISIGHTQADYATSIQAFKNGAGHVTHLFNAMPGFHHRDTGVVGAAFDTPSVQVELICDGVHLSDTMIRSSFALFSDKRVIMISDSMRATGMPDGSYTLGGLPVSVNGKYATLADNTLAGSVTNLLDCLRYTVQQVGIPFESALKACTINPARELHVESLHGQIMPNAYANLLILDHNLELKDIIFHGKILG